tara:strand:- start:3918 stop:5504 length:1587 start_codon:yes stop_codon:yes gene_type:complete
MQVYDRVIFYSGTDTLVSLTVGVIIALAFDFIIRQARSGLLQNVSSRIDRNLNNVIFEYFEKAPFEEIEIKSEQHWKSYFSDVEFLRNIFGGPTIGLIFELPFLCIAMLLVYLIAEAVFIFFLAAVIFFASAAWLSNMFLGRYQKREQESLFLARQALNQLIAHRSTIKAIGVEDVFVKKWLSEHSELKRFSINRGKVGDFFLNLSAVSTPSTTILITVAGAVAVIDQSLSIGALVAANMLVGRTIGPLQQLINVTNLISRVRYSAGRLQDVEPSSLEKKANRLLDEAVVLENMQFNDVEFHFKGDVNKVLGGVNISLGGVGYTCVVGKNGSGKSTLLKMCMGLYQPTSGEIFLGDINLKNISRDYIDEYFSFVPQDNIIFNGSIRFNLSLRDPNVAEKDLVGVCREFGFHDEVQKIEQGYEFQVGEGGYRLSPGQRQKIAIIRSLIGPSKVIIMDEPTSNLDRQSEVLLRDYFLNKSHDKHMIIATHSPYILSGASRLIIIDDGRVVLDGPGTEMLPKIGLSPFNVD